MTASRARSNDIGSERENSRIGTRRSPAFPAGFEPLPEDFFRAMIDGPYSAMAGSNACGATGLQRNKQQFGLNRDI
jgi:hypothetical protein